MHVMGIDPSINCIGVCITNDKENIYILIPGRCTKKMQQFKSDFISIQCYNKLDYKDLEYDQKEYIKASNVHRICTILEDLIKEYNIEYVYMEGVSYGSVSGAALVDLSGLNFAIRYMLICNNIKFTIVAPTGLKKFAVANGAADKDLMVYAWHTLQPQMKNIKDIKVDDLADAFFLAHYKNP